MLKQQERQQRGEAIGNWLMDSFDSARDRNRAWEDRQDRIRRQEEEDRLESIRSSERLRLQEEQRQRAHQSQQPTKQPQPLVAPTPPPEVKPYVPSQLGDVLSDQQAWEAKVKAVGDKLAENAGDQRRIEEGWTKSKAAQSDAMKANADGTTYGWLAQGGGLLSMLSGFGDMATALIPNEAIRKQLETGKAAATVISATTEAAYDYGANPQANALDAAASSTKAMAAADKVISKYTETAQSKELKTGSKLIGIADKINDGEYKKAGWEIAKLLKGEAVKRETDFVDGAIEVVGGAKKISEAQDEKDRIAARTDSQKQNFSDSNDRINAALIKKQYEEQQLLEEMKRLNQQAPKTANAPLAKP